MKKTIITVVAILIVLVGGYFVLKGSYQTPTQIATPTPTISKETAASTIKELVVSGNEYSFNPVNITVKAGERVKITFQNTGRAPHNLIIEGLGTGTKTIRGGEADAVEFTAPAAGTYPVFCSMPGHRADGMEGQLIVE